MYSKAELFSVGIQIGNAFIIGTLAAEKFRGSRQTIPKPSLPIPKENQIGQLKSGKEQNPPQTIPAADRKDRIANAGPNGNGVQKETVNVATQTMTNLTQWTRVHTRTRLKVAMNTLYWLVSHHIFVGNWSRGIPKPGESLRTEGIPQVEL